MRGGSVNQRAILALACVSLLGGCAVFASKEAVVWCQAADAVTTLHAIDLGAREANPVVDWLLKEFGPGGFIAAKASATLLFLNFYPHLSADLVRLVNGVTCAVAARNAWIASQLEDEVPPERAPEE